MSLSKLFAMKVSLLSGKVSLRTTPVSDPIQFSLSSSSSRWIRSTSGIVETRLAEAVSKWHVSVVVGIFPGCSGNHFLHHCVFLLRSSSGTSACEKLCRWTRSLLHFYHSCFVTSWYYYYYLYSRFVGILLDDFGSCSFSREIADLCSSLSTRFISL